MDFVRSCKRSDRNCAALLVVDLAKLTRTFQELLSVLESSVKEMGSSDLVRIADWSVLRSGTDDDQTLVSLLLVAGPNYGVDWYRDNTIIGPDILRGSSKLAEGVVLLYLAHRWKHPLCFCNEVENLSPLPAHFQALAMRSQCCLVRISKRLRIK